MNSSPTSKMDTVVLHVYLDSISYELIDESPTYTVRKVTLQYIYMSTVNSDCTLLIGNESLYVYNKNKSCTLLIRTEKSKCHIEYPTIHKSLLSSSKFSTVGYLAV